MRRVGLCPPLTISTMLGIQLKPKTPIVVEFRSIATVYPQAMPLQIQQFDPGPSAVTENSLMDILLDEWRAHILTEADHFVGDGVVCQESWRTAKRKVLFLLKEPNGYKGEDGPLNVLLRKAAAPNSMSKMWDRPTFHNVGRWTYGLLNYSDHVPAYDDAHRACKTAVLDCAYINIKKSSGGARATRAVEEHAAQYAEFLRRQVAIINPDIVVCGGTYPMLKKHVYPSLSRVSSRIHAFDKRLFINAFHPACRTRREDVYGQVLSSFHQYVIASTSRTIASVQS